MNRAIVLAAVGGIIAGLGACASAMTEPASAAAPTEKHHCNAAGCNAIAETAKDAGAPPARAVNEP